MYPLAKRKRAANSIVTVSVGGNLCLPSCLYLGKYRQTHDVTGSDRNTWYNMIRADGKHRLEQKVSSDLRVNRLPVGMAYTLSDIDHIQRVLYPDYQIKVFSEGDCGIIARCPEHKSKGMKEIYVLLGENHYDLITTMSGYLGCSYYCEVCEKGYDHKENHYCTSVCPECHCANEECLPDCGRFCIDCRRMFRSEHCYQQHVRREICKYHFKCKNCEQYINLLKHKGHKHKCGESFCKTCQEFVDPNSHRCFLKKLKPQVKTYSF